MEGPKRIGVNINKFENHNIFLAFIKRTSITTACLINAINIVSLDLHFVYSIWNELKANDKRLSLAITKFFALSVCVCEVTDLSVYVYVI